MLDRSLTLALGMVSNPGAYALLLGSGVSGGSAIKTGWEVLMDLTTRLGRVQGVGATELADPLAWYRSATGREATYSAVLEDLAPSAHERMALLRGYFEPAEGEREQGLKQPSRAHRAIAALVETGAVKVIVTTNFDRLMEQALGEVGVAPVVVSSPDSAESAPPYAHVRCVLVKIHGDYLDSRLLNTETELQQYDERMHRLVARIVGDHGMVVVGWSGAWDPALRSILTDRGRGLYTDYWVARRDPEPSAAQAIAAVGAESLRAQSADDFFGRLLEQVRSLHDLMRGSRLADREAVATAKRLLARQGGGVALADLVAQLEAETRAAVADVGSAREGADQAGYASAIEAIEAVVTPLAGVCAAITRWGSDADLELVSDVIRRLGSTRATSGLTAFLALRHYPASLVLYSAGVASVAIRRYGAVDRLLRTTVHADGTPQPAFQALVVARALNHQALNRIEVARDGGDPSRTRRKTPISDHIARFIDMALPDVVHTPDDRADFFDNFEVILSAVAEIRGSEPFPGRFLWRTGGGGDAIVRLLNEGMDAGDAWEAVRHGLFSSLDEFKDAILRVKETYRAVAW